MLVVGCALQTSCSPIDPVAHRSKLDGMRLRENPKFIAGRIGASKFSSAKTDPVELSEASPFCVTFGPVFPGGGKEWIHNEDPLELVGLPTEKGGFPEKGHSGGGGGEGDTRCSLHGASKTGPRPFCLQIWAICKQLVSPQAYDFSKRDIA